VWRARARGWHGAPSEKAGACCCRLDVCGGMMQMVDDASRRRPSFACPLSTAT
jgi:hypothetical protein